MASHVSPTYSTILHCNKLDSLSIASIHNRPCIFIYSYIICVWMLGAGMGLWRREHSPHTNVAWVPYQSWRRMWVEFVGSLLCTKGFLSLGSPVSPSPQNPTVTSIDVR